NQEDLENEKRIINPSYRDKSLEAVRKALSILLPEYSNLTVRRSPLRMEMKKNGQTVRVEGLSDGEKCLIALVGDLARRLSMANACLEDPLKGLGIVLIDEIDLHLHPAWQRNVVKKLTEAFPNCQFIMSTHSPQILGDVPAGNILLLEHTNNGIEIRHPLRSLGLSSNEAIDELMGDSSGLMLSQNEDVNRDLQEIYRLIDEERYDAASRAIEMLQRRVSEIPSVIEARTYLESVR
ncbi:AAA family ATPase, partial [uncultured Fibrobacter sp.]